MRSASGSVSLLCRVKSSTALSLMTVREARGELSTTPSRVLQRLRAT